jgi:hypothetical protein
MPAHDIFHGQVKNALIKDGWTITDDPLKIKWRKKKLFVDLGAEKLLAAEKGERKIAVEIKSFVGKSDTNDLEDAVGQYVLYETLLEETNSDRTLYLAVHNIAFEAVFVQSFGAVLLKKGTVRLLVFDPRKEEILQWIP